MALFISCLLYYFYYFFWLSSLLHLHFHCIYVLSISEIVLGIGFKPIILAFVMNIALVSSWCTLYFFCRSNTISWFCSLLLHFSLLSYSFIYFVYLGNLGKLLEKKKNRKNIDQIKNHTLTLAKNWCCWMIIELFKIISSDIPPFFYGRYDTNLSQKEAVKVKKLYSQNFLKYAPLKSGRWVSSFVIIWIWIIENLQMKVILICK